MLASLDVLRQAAAQRLNDDGSVVAYEFDTISVSDEELAQPRLAEIPAAASRQRGIGQVREAGDVRGDRCALHTLNQAALELSSESQLRRGMTVMNALRIRFAASKIAACPLTFAAAFCAMSFTPAAQAADVSKDSVVDAEGTVHVPAFMLPFSDMSSPEARKNFIDITRGFESLRGVDPGKDIEAARRQLDDKLMKPNLARLRAVFPVTITAEKIAGVQTDIVAPAGKISQKNAKRVLINLHGGGFVWAARYGGQMESVPVASLGGIKVITVDYREGPEHRFPAASEDVAAVYRELLKTYAPENVGIYGCSAGALLTAESVAWFQKQQLPGPGAIGIFGYGGSTGIRGDSNYLSAALTGKPLAVEAPRGMGSYFDVPGLDFNDPLVSPVKSPTVLAKFPPALLITGTRDIGLSHAAYMHSQLIKAGVEADLHVWEGAPHCSFAQPVVNPNEPESREAWDVIVKFFDKHLGKRS